MLYFISMALTFRSVLAITSSFSDWIVCVCSTDINWFHMSTEWVLIVRSCGWIDGVIVSNDSRCSSTLAVDRWAVDIGGRSGMSCLKTTSYGLFPFVEWTCRFMESIASGSASHHSGDCITVIYTRIFVFSTPFACLIKQFVWGVRGLLWTTGIPWCFTRWSHAPLNSIPLSHWRIPGTPNIPKYTPRCNATL